MAITPYCTDALSVKVRGSLGEAHAIRCKRWSCPTCSQMNRNRVIAIAREANPRALLTLTVSSKHYATPDDAARALVRGLRLLRLRLSRDPHLRNFEFICVFEEHKSTYPHMHLLIRGDFIPWKQLRTWWEQITGSTHIHITRIKTTGQAAYYCAKYIGKNLAAFEGCKRWWRSKGYSAEVPPYERPIMDGPRPERYVGHLDRWAFNLKLSGWTVEKTPDKGIRWRWDHGEGEPPGWLWSATGGENRPLSGRGR